MVADSGAPARDGAGRAASLDTWGLVWQGFFGLTLLAPTAIAVAGAPTAAHGAVTAGLAAGLAAWHWVTALRHLEREGSPVMLLWFAGTMAFTWLLLGRDSSYLFLIYGLYPQLFGLLGHFAVPAVVVLTVLVFWRTGVLGGEGISTWLVSVGGSVLLSAMIGLFITALIRQSAARKQALDDLEATRAELAATSRRAGVLAERERLARDLHDTVAQAFTGIVMQLEASEQALDADPARAREHLLRARGSARDSLGELRRAVHDLRPEVLVGATLTEAVERAARRWSDESGIPAHASASGTPRKLPPEAEVALLRAAQEALANVAKHARATTATLRLDYGGSDVVLTVHDDGVGFDPAGAATDGGVGLKGIAERMAALGGRFDVDSVPGQGTTLTARLPVR